MGKSRKNNRETVSANFSRPKDVSAETCGIDQINALRHNANLRHIVPYFNSVTFRLA